jgi:hypothetical protein
MRLVIDLDEKYKTLYYEVAKATEATIIEQELEFWSGYPEHVKEGVKKSREQVANGQTRWYDEVKKMLPCL